MWFAPDMFSFMYAKIMLSFWIDWDANPKVRRENYIYLLVQYVIMCWMESWNKSLLGEADSITLSESLPNPAISTHAEIN